MKRIALVLLGAQMAVAAFGLVGCGATTQVDTARLRQAYAATLATVRSHVERAVARLGARNFPEGIRALRDAVQQSPPTEAQKDALLDVIKQVQMIMAQNPKFDVNATYAALEELDAAIEGRASNFIPKTTEPPR